MKNLIYRRLGGARGDTGAIISDNLLHSPCWHELLVVAACAEVLGAVGTLVVSDFSEALRG